MAHALVLRAPGTNCDAEMCRAFREAGAAVDLVHIDTLIAEPQRLRDADLIGFPGGFSYGDDIASGRILAMKLRERLYPALREAASRGAMMIGACNGFQVLVQVGLLPGPGAGQPWPIEQAPPQTVSLSDNQGARFVARWVGVAYERGSACLWTRGLSDMFDADASRQVQQLPVAHGEGRVSIPDMAIRSVLERQGQVALRYTDNYNGSDSSIAGLCDASGRIFGLMPHPERYLDWNRHPFRARLPNSITKGETPGARIFRNAVEAVRGTPSTRHVLASSA